METHHKQGYKQSEVGVIPEDWEVSTLEVISKSISSGKSHTTSTSSGDFPIFGSTGVIGLSRTSDYSGNRVLIARVGANAGAVYTVSGSYNVSDNTLMVSLSNVVDFLYITYFLKNLNLNQYVFGSGQPLITGSQLKSINLPLPPLPEQTAIASALSDMDALIAQTEKLIEKKKAIKQGVMQELLRPKEGWVKRKLGEVLKIRHGKDQKQVQSSNGQYPILGTGGLMGYANNYLYNKPSVLIGRKGTIDKPQYMETPFWTVDTLFYSEISENYSARFIFYLFQQIEWKSFNEASGVPSLNAKTIENIEVSLPSFEEQNRIAGVIYEFEKENKLADSKIQKLKLQKQGMMQALLTGKIRLV